MEERLQYLFKRYFDNSCSRQELEEFFTYINEAKHDESLRQLIKKLYQEIKGTPLHANFVDSEGHLVLSPEDEKEEDVIINAKRRRTLSPVIIAIALLIAGGSTWLLFQHGKAKSNMPMVESHTKKTTDRSEYKYIVLGDSTKVWLNAASSLEFPDHFNSNKREVFLDGEAYFDVMHADKIPFVIHTGAVSTTVLGTAFNIKAYPNERSVTVSVSRGKVRVSRGNGWSTTLTKGQQVKLEEDKGITSEKPIAPTDVAAWQHGNIVYDDETIEHIIADMERVYNISVSLPDTMLREVRISTSFKKEIGAEQALHVLCKLTDTKLKRSGNNYIIQ
jgi:transmembrane sensor